MALFQSSVLKKYLQGLDSVKLESAYQNYIAHFHNPKHSGQYPGS